MNWYVAESRDSSITHRGARSVGVRCEAYETWGPIYMYIVDLTDDEYQSLRPLQDEDGQDARQGGAPWPIAVVVCP